MPRFYPAIALGDVLPELILAAGGCAVLLLTQSRRDALRRSGPALTFATLVLAILLTVWRAAAGAAGGTGGGLAYGTLAAFTRNSALVLGVVITLVAWLQPPQRERGEFWSTLLFALLGLMLVGAAADLLMLFIALELVSIPTYILVALSRRNLRALEAGTKYFYLGALATALNAYGFSLLYGVTGTNALDDMARPLAAALDQVGTLAGGLATLGVVLSLAGLFFKIAAVPLHFYVADVYQGAASPVAGLLGFVPKFAGLLAIIKVVQLTGHWQHARPSLFWLLWVVAVLSMFVGNFLALRQTNVKRLLAYSGIAHSGYMLVGVLLGPDAGYGVMGDGTAAVLYYAVIYGLANLGGFAVLGLLRVRGRPCETLRDLAGLLRAHPGLALLMTWVMLTLIGLPPTAGFWGKLGLFGGALTGFVTGDAPAGYDRGLIVLAIIGVLNSAVSAAYYLRVVAAMLVYENDRPAEAVPHESQHLGAALCGFLLLVFAFYPALLLQPGRRATADLRPLPDTLLIESARPAAPPPTAPRPPDEHQQHRQSQRQVAARRP